MSTNFFVRNCPNPCEHCAADAEVHLGQSAAGWRFLLYADPDWPRDEAFTLWLQRAMSGPIFDEYGHPFSVGDLLGRMYGRRDQRSRVDVDGMGVFACDGHEFSTRWFR